MELEQIIISLHEDFEDLISACDEKDTETMKATLLHIRDMAEKALSKIKT